MHGHINLAIATDIAVVPEYKPVPEYKLPRFILRHLYSGSQSINCQGLYSGCPPVDMNISYSNFGTRWEIDKIAAQQVRKKENKAKVIFTSKVL